MQYPVIDLSCDAFHPCFGCELGHDQRRNPPSCGACQVGALHAGAGRGCARSGAAVRILAADSLAIGMSEGSAGGGKRLAAAGGQDADRTQPARGNAGGLVDTQRAVGKCCTSGGLALAVASGLEVGASRPMLA